MNIAVFSKRFRDYRIEELATLGQELGTEGWDLAVRRGYPVNPDNVGQTLGDAARFLQDVGQPVLAVTGETDLLYPETPYATPLLRAMDAANIRLLKLGYFLFDPERQQYWQEVDRVRRALEGWQKLARRYEVKVVYHTHSGRGYLGTNASALMHLLHDFDPQYLGAYLDAGHLLVNGEPFEFALAITQPYLCMVGLKDFRPNLKKHGDQGQLHWDCVPAGQGGVRWSEVFRALARADFTGPCSVHAEFELPANASLVKLVQAEVAYFKKKRSAAREG